MCRNLYRTTSILGQHQFFAFICRKLLLNHTDYFEKLNMLHRKIRVNDSFDVSKVGNSIQNKKEHREHGKSSKEFEDVELQALLDEDDSQTQKQLS